MLLMDAVSGAFHPFLIVIAIGLTIMASYTGLDMFTLIKSSKSKKDFCILAVLYQWALQSG